MKRHSVSLDYRHPCQISCHMANTIRECCCCLDLMSMGLTCNWPCSVERAPLTFSAPIEVATGKVARSRAGRSKPCHPKRRLHIAKKRLPLVPACATMLAHNRRSVK